MLARIRTKIRISKLANGSVFSGTAWTATVFAYRSVLRLLSTVVITRLLDPESFGLMSLAMVFVIGLNLFSDIGIAPSVIQSRRGDNEDFLRTAWTIKVLRGLFLFVVGLLIAYPASIIYDEPRLFELVCVLSLVPLLDGFMSISQLSCERKIDLKAVSIIEIVAATGATVLTIFFAWQLKTVWALAIGTISGSIIRTFASHVFLPTFKHRIFANRKDAIEILTFGGWILLATIASFMMHHGLVLIQGMLVSVTVIGFLTLSYTLAWALGELVDMVVGKVFFPAMAKVARERPSELPKKVQSVMTIVYYFILPLFLFLSLLAQPIIDFIYDQRYSVVGKFVSIMSINSSLIVFSAPYTNVVLARGDARSHFILASTAAVFRIGPMIAGFYLGGAFGMLIGIGLGVVAFNLLMIYVAERISIGNWRRDAAMLLIWATILCLVFYFVADQDSHVLL